MDLYLVQHGQATSKEEDPQRPLSETGRRDVERVARFLAAQRTATFSRINHSGKARTAQTAEIIRGYLLGIETVEQADHLDPLADPLIWADRLAKGFDGLMLVGHLPHLDRLAAALVAGDTERSVVAFEMGGIVCLNRDERGTWRIGWMITPRLLK